MTMTKDFRSLTFTFAALLLATTMAHVSDAFSMTPAHKAREAMLSTTAIGYTLQMPDFINSLPKSTWYDVANPTARRIVYDE